MGDITLLAVARGRAVFEYIANPEEVRKARMAELAKVAQPLVDEIRRVLDCGLTFEYKPFKELDCAQSPLIDRYTVILDNPLIEKYSDRMDYHFMLNGYGSSREEAVAMLYDHMTRGMAKDCSIRKYHSRARDTYDEYRFDGASERLRHTGAMDHFGLPMKLRA